MDNMYEILMSLPLLNGASRQRILDIAGKTKFHFLKYTDGETVAAVGEPCTHIKFLLSGAVRSSINTPDGRFSVAQTLTAPSVIAPEFLFGKSPYYPATVTSVGASGFLQIAKADYLSMLMTDQVFTFNFLNMLSSSSQKLIEGMLAVTNGALEDRIAYWIAALTQRDGTNIVMSCRHRDLCATFGVPRSSLNAALESLRNRGLIEYNNTAIRVISRTELLKLLQTPEEEI